MKLRVAGIVPESIVDGPGIRLTLFVQGCPLGCTGCHNPAAQDPQGGEEMELAEILDRIKSAPYLDGVTFSGGEPFFQATPLALLGEEIRRLGLHLVIFSGYTFEELLAKSRVDEGVRRLLAAGDLLVDGRYVEEERDLSLAFRGSKNQRLLDLPRSLARSEAVPYVLNDELVRGGPGSLGPSHREWHP